MNAPQSKGRTAPEHRVCLDARSQALARGTGVSTYATVLADTLPLAGYGVELLTDTAEHRHGRLRRWASALSPVPWPAPQLMHAPDGQVLRQAWDTFRTAQVHFDVYRRLLVLRDAVPPDLMHWTYPIPLRFAGVPNLYTVHDLIPVLQPTLSPIASARLRRILHRIGRTAAHIVTVSEAARQDILTTMGWPPDQVTNTYQAVHMPPNVMATPADVAATTQRLVGTVPGGFFLHVGSVEPRKNLARLIDAYKASGVTAPLVIAGPDGWRAAAELHGAQGLLAATGSGPRVVRLPWLARRDLVSLMRAARAVLLPSLAEGFGLPVIEAMQLGVPTLTSAGGATAEVAGGAALLADPRDTRDVAGALARLDCDAALRAALVDRGWDRASLFTPAAYAGRMDALYRRVLAQPPGAAGIVAACAM